MPCHAPQHGNQTHTNRYSHSSQRRQVSMRKQAKQSNSGSHRKQLSASSQASSHATPGSAHNASTSSITSSAHKPRNAINQLYSAAQPTQCTAGTQRSQIPAQRSRSAATPRKPAEHGEATSANTSSNAASWDESTIKRQAANNSNACRQRKQANVRAGKATQTTQAAQTNSVLAAAVSTTV